MAESSELLENVLVHGRQVGEVLNPVFPQHVDQQLAHSDVFALDVEVHVHA